MVPVQQAYCRKSGHPLNISKFYELPLLTISPCEKSKLTFTLSSSPAPFFAPYMGRSKKAFVDVRQGGDR